jgi:nitrate reductase NapAB chaperone NapD
MPVSGVLLTCKGESVEAVRRQIDARPLVEMRQVEGSMLVVVTDTATLDEDRREVQWLAGIPGVLSAFVAFCNIEDLAEAPAAGATT